jgi:putative FmdB family regulatory protein
MPIYEYRCDNGHTFEVMQRMADDALTECSICGAPVQRVFHPVAIHFKGSGFYNTDYGKRNRGTSRDGEGSKESSKESKDSKGSKESKEPAKSSSAKSDTKSPDSPSSS